MTIVLLGYMGCGKTFIGSQLSNVLNYEYLDLDAYIETEERMTIADIFKEKGELYFRKIEKTYLEALLKQSDKRIISLGGGTPCYFDTMETLIANSKVKTIYLKVSIPVLTARLFKEKSHRPLISHLQTEDELSEFIGKHLFERSPFYNKSEIIVDANQAPTDIINQVVLQLF